MEPLVIDCGCCARRGTSTCSDCLVTFLVDRDEQSAVIIPFEEIRAVRLLQEAGLAPKVRHEAIV